MVETRQLTHRFDDGVLGLDRVDLRLGAGEYVVVAGENGSGKTLLMRHLVGLARPTAGEVLFEGRPLAGQLAQARQAIGLVFQDSSAQIVGLTVGEEVAFGPRNHGWPRGRVEAAVAEALAAVGLAGREAQPCAQLSGGERRRLAIAGVLVLRPRLVVLDEPFTGLDYPSVRGVLAALRDLHAAGTTVVVLTHELDKCLAHATRLVLLRRARVLADGPPSALWDRIGEAAVYRPEGTADRIGEMTWLA